MARYRLGRLQMSAKSLPGYVAAWALVFLVCALFGHCLGMAVHGIYPDSPIGAAAIRLPIDLPVNNLSLFGAAVGLFLIITLNIRLQRATLLPVLIFNLPLYIASILTPKNPNRWLFASRQGSAFAENSKYLFMYVSRECPDIEAIWITKSRIVYHSLKSRGYKACMAHSPAGYWYTMTAGVLFFTHYKLWEPDGNGYVLGPGTILMQLWHGSPIKRLGNSIESRGESPFSVLVAKTLKTAFPFLAMRTSCHRMLAACPIVARHLRDSFNLTDSSMLVTGYPKNDNWLERTMTAPAQEVRKVIYMPTFRQLDWQLFVDFEFDLQRLNRVCRDNNIEFYIKLHPYSLERVEPIMKRLGALSNIAYCESGDIYEILDQFDVLVTDYSSISFDYLLCGRPIIFAPFDYESYKNEERGFLEDYNSLTPGPHAKNWLELEELLTSGVDEYSAERTALNDRYNSFQGSDSARQLVETTRAMLKANVGKERAKSV